MSNLSKIILSLFFVFSVSGCQNTPKVPDWYLSVEADDGEYYYSVGRGRSLNQAKKVSLNQISEKLWTQVKSSNKLREVVRSNNDKESYQTFNDFNIRTNSALLTFTGAEYLKSENSNEEFYVATRIKKSVIAKQLERELKDIDQTSKDQVNALQYEDDLLWWLKNRNTSERKKEILIKKSILSVMRPDLTVETANFESLLSKIKKVRDKIVFYVSSTRIEPRFNQFIKDTLTKEGLKTVSNKRKATHFFMMSINHKQSKVGSAYITTVISDLSIKNKKQHNIASVEVISSGNSISNYAISSEGAARHFKQQIEESSIWQMLGVE